MGCCSSSGRLGGQRRRACGTISRFEEFKELRGDDALMVVVVVVGVVVGVDVGVVVDEHERRPECFISPHPTIP